MKKVLLITNIQSSRELVNFLREHDYSPIIVDNQDEGLEKLKLFCSMWNRQGKTV